MPGSRVFNVVKPSDPWCTKNSICIFQRRLIRERALLSTQVLTKRLSLIAIDPFSLRIASNPRLAHLRMSPRVVNISDKLHSMKIVRVLIPSASAMYDSALAFYRDTLELPISRDFHDQISGFHFTILEPMLLLRADNAEDLRVPATVHAILIVDDIAAFWERVQTKAEIVVPLQEIPTGRRFIVTHPDKKTIEYLQLAK